MTINWVGGMLSVLVLGLLLLAGFMLQNSVRLLITGKRVEGVVVGMDTSSRLSGSSTDTPLKSPMVEFSVSTGERIRVSGRSYSESPSIRVGDLVTVAYSPSNPRNAQLLLWSDFPLVPAGFVLGFIAIILLIWVSGILISGNSKMDDPFHLLPALISHFRLNPVRFPALFILSIAIPACGLGTYLTLKTAIGLRSEGIRATGHVVGSQRVTSSLSDGSTGSGVFPMITFKDASGAPHIIRRSLAKPLSRLKPGDEVEVIYPARHPEQGVVNTWDEFWPPPLFFGFMMLAFIIIFRIVFSRASVTSNSNPGSEKKLRKSGVQAVATVIEANVNTHLLHYRIDKETEMPAAKSNDFITLEISLSDWEPSQSEALIIKDNLAPAFEKLMTGIMNLPKPLPKLIQGIDWND
ncbi:MAG: DUF3592 domain-containing protein [Bacteroidetes bacterium]|nr:DUF3592 domain-containing protein [Bacteroidota bacterium]